MENTRFFRENQLVIFGIIIAFGVIFAAAIVGNTAYQIKKLNSEFIKVTGSAKKNIKSDRVIWEFQVYQRSIKPTDAYKGLNNATGKVITYLTTKGISPKSITKSIIRTNMLYKRTDNGRVTHEIDAYQTYQTFKVESNDVDKIAQLSQSAAELINQGVFIRGSFLKYFYIKLESLKIEMLAKATENAKQRAQSMLKATKNNIYSMQSAKMGVFQITPADSTAVSSLGINDTSSLNKQITAVVSVIYTIR